MTDCSIYSCFLEHLNFQIVQSPSYVAIVQEYAENGDILKLVKKLGHIDEVECRFLFRQLIEAIMVAVLIIAQNNDSDLETIIKRLDSV